MWSKREAYIALNMMTGMGPVRARALETRLGSIEAIFAAGERDLESAEGVGRELASAIILERNRVDPQRELERAERLGISIVTPAEAGYPEPLRNIYDPPLALYMRGAWEKRDRQAVAVVGTRRPTYYGAAVADRLAYQLGRVGCAVVSGLARGIDTAAHRGALKAKARTLAVIGSALDRLYPPENADLAEQIAQNGAVISEYPLGREPDRTTFPYRNRIVSGLSMGVVVVEAGQNSGALHTAHQAMEQGRAVFAVPGRIDTPSAKGCHKLLKQGARLVEDLDDIMEEFEFLFPRTQRDKAASLDALPRVALDEQEQAVVKALWTDALDVDSLVRVTGLRSGELSALLIRLEMKRVVRMLPGRRVELTEAARTAGEHV
jgi:DNA processing protein